MNHKMTRIANNHKTVTGIILTTMASTLFMVVLITQTLGHPANARILTNADNINAIQNTNCDGDVCQTLSCINSNCRENSSQVSNSNSTTPCFLPCLPSPSKSP